MRHISLPVNELTHEVALLIQMMLWWMLTHLSMQLRRLARSFYHTCSWLLRLSLSHYRYSDFVLAFSFSRRPRVNNFNLVSVWVCWLLVHFVLWNHTRRLHVEMTRFILVLAIIINTWLIEVLVEILNWVVHIWIGVFWPHSAQPHLSRVWQLSLATDNALVIILVEQLNTRRRHHLENLWKS